MFFSTINYDEEIFCFDPKLKLPDNNMSYYDILLITGIANPKTFVEEVKRYSSNVKHLLFNDHHSFTTEDISLIKKNMKN